MAGKNGRSKYYKIVMSPCSGGDVVSFYCGCLIYIYLRRDRQTPTFRLHALGIDETPSRRVRIQGGSGGRNSARELQRVGPRLRQLN